MLRFKMVRGGQQISWMGLGYFKTAPGSQLVWLTKDKDMDIIMLAYLLILRLKDFKDADVKSWRLHFENNITSVSVVI